MDYLELLKEKEKTHIDSGFDCKTKWRHLYPFQQYCVRLALKKGRFAMFEDCGLGKTRQQITWAQEVVKHEKKPVIILAPLAVVYQTISEGVKIGIEVIEYNAHSPLNKSVYITNYEQLEHIVASDFIGIVLDESSIIKNFEGAYRNLLIENFNKTPYKLCCTATPSPNDPMELGNHSEFLNIMPYNEMLAMYFVHDGGETAKWRLKGHCENLFWDFVSSWAIMLSKPSDIGFDDAGYNLPALNYFEKLIITEKKDNGSLFNDTAISATTHNAELRLTAIPRLESVVEIINSKPNEDFIVWVKQNAEGEALRKLIPNAKEICGSDSNEYKKQVPLWFTSNRCICHLLKKRGENITENGELTTQIDKKNILIEQDQKNQNQQQVQKKNSIIKNGINSINIGFPNTETLQKISEIFNEEKIINLIKTIQERRQFEHLKKELLIIQTLGLNAVLSDMELLLNNIMKFLSDKMEDAPFVELIHLLSIASSGYMLTIAIPQKKLEDCFALTATMASGNLKTTSNFYKKQSCTCGANEKGKILISKAKILGFGMNFQNCHNMIFASPDFSFEMLYQAVRREWRFGQIEDVNAWLIITDTMQNISQAIKRKQAQFEDMQKAMQISMNSSFKHKTKMKRENKKYESAEADIRLGDSIQLIDTLADESIGFSIWSPPFPELYVYSDEIEDLGNCKDYDEFMKFFSFIPKKLFRVMWSGRNVAIHCMDTPIQKGKEGYIGLRDFSGMIIKLMTDAGFIYHSRVTIWKDPVTEMQRTKALGLLHKQVKKDAAMSRVGIPDYLLVFRKPGEHAHPVKCDIPVDLWQQYASPVWMDINYGETLNKQQARAEKDEKHICPLQLQTIERATHLWSNKGDTCLSMFGGIGSEPFEFIKLDRKAVAFELKTSYYDVMVKNVKSAETNKQQATLLFD